MEATEKTPAQFVLEAADYYAKHPDEWGRNSYTCCVIGKATRLAEAAGVLPKETNLSYFTRFEDWYRSQYSSQWRRQTPTIEDLLEANDDADNAKQMRVKVRKLFGATP